MLTTPQLQALKAAALADPTATNYWNNGNDTQLTEWFNTATTTVVWKTAIPVREVGQAMRNQDISNLTTANTNRLLVMVQYADGTFVPSDDLRAGFADVFGTSGAAPTRANLDTLWRRMATRAEKTLATGTGTTQAPATLGWEGLINLYDITNIRGV